MEQIERLNPPANQVKDSDSRAEKYRKQYGNQCWELDTLPPHELNQIIETAIIANIDDMDDFNSRKEEDVEGQEQLRVVGKHFDEAHERAKSCEDEEEFEDDECEDDEEEFGDDEYEDDEEAFGDNE